MHVTVTSTSGPQRRERNLRRVHLAAIAIPTLVILVACLIIARNVVEAGKERRNLQDVGQELVQLRHLLQDQNARYWSRRALGGSVVPSTDIQQALLNGQVRFNDLARRRAGHPDEARAISDAREALADLAVIVLAPSMPLRDMAAVRDAETQAQDIIARIDRALSLWVNDLQRDIHASSRTSDTFIAQLLMALGALVAILVIAAVVVWTQIDRQRRRAVDEIAAERDSSHLVMESVQDGLMELDALGRIKWMNPRMEELIDASEAELIGSFPPWADDIPVGFTGDTDLIVRRDDGTERDVLLTVSRLAGDRGFLHVGKDMTLRRRAESELRALSMEREVLREVATVVAAGPDPQEVFELVAHESARLLGADAAVIRKFDDSTDRVIDMGQWVRTDADIDEPPTRIRLSSDAPVARLLRTGTSARVDDVATLDNETAAQFMEAGYRTSVAVLVRVGDLRWGVLEAFSRTAGSLPPDAETRLMRFAELVGMTVSNAAANARLADQAGTDPLTGLANHRRFHERLRAQAAAAHASHGDLAMVLVDLDRFADVNAAFGHRVGDQVLAEVARRLASEARAGETVARVGGEQFAWLLPDADGLDAWRAAERARAAIGGSPFRGVGTVTASVGVADLAQATGVDDLVRLADGALYWAKATGRNRTLRYSPEVVKDLSSSERAERLARTQAVTALRALARAVDAKDPSTARHAERVATLSVEIARVLEWNDDRLQLLEEAALLHDVGKIGVSDAILMKSGRLTDEERETVKGHAALGAEIVSDVLSPEQVSWIRAHHERWDGTGYPDGLADEDIPDGARIITVADAWDAMTSVRTYGSSRQPIDAYQEIVRNAGGQFSPDVVAAFQRVWRANGVAVAPSLVPGESVPGEPAEADPASH